MDSTGSYTTYESSDAQVQLKRIFERRKERNSNPLQPTQNASTSQMVRTIYGVYSPVPMSRPTPHSGARQHQQKTKAKKKAHRKRINEPTVQNPQETLAKPYSNTPGAEDLVQAQIPSFLIESMLGSGLGISEGDDSAQLEEMTPELKEMFRLFTNVEVD